MSSPQQIPDTNDTKNVPYQVWESCLKMITPPPPEKMVWRVPDGNQLGLLLIEFRSHPWLPCVLNNVAHVYGGTNVSLYVVHGIDNEAFARQCLKDWENVVFIKLDHHNIDREKYAKLCCDPALYRRFNTQFVLKFEIDTLTRQPIPDIFFQYAYVGAPWTGYPNDWPDNPQVRVGNKLVGNGGYSLRNVKRMIELCEQFPKPPRLGEDVHLTNCLHNSEVPSVDLAKEFSVEWVYYPNPCGLHQSWRFHSLEVIVKWFEYTPGFEFKKEVQ